ncbi:hypothetical protein H312_02887 [Anncaliia algerae PRA339]|uniref:Uncharacterized protein n=1 Tax=Anncaliia algerae PRA339 TaxID=1288291 RepID=A0A059EYC4_9MICR|nr:hypothetical protein H312_02887 [Anncaliia algerae PRA339]
MSLLYFLFSNFDSSISTSMFEPPNFLKLSLYFGIVTSKTILNNHINVGYLINSSLQIIEFFILNNQRSIIAHVLKKDNLMLLKILFSHIETVCTQCLHGHLFTYMFFLN